MTVESNVVTAGPFEGNGVTETFSFGFAIMSASDLLVYHYDSEDTPSLLVKDTDYSVSGIGDSEGGSITLLTGALASGDSLRLRSNYDLTQSASFPSQGRFYPEEHEKVIDSLARQIQQLNYEFSRLSTSSQEPTSLPAVTAGTVAANTVAADTVTADTVSTDTVTTQVLDAESFSGRAIDEFISTFEGVEGVLPLSTPRLFGDGTTTDFAVSVPSGAVFQSAFYVNISGNKQRHTLDFIYSNANSQIEFVTAPPDGAAIDVIYFSPATIDPSSVPVRPVVDIATLRNTEPQSATDQILLLGHTTPGVGGGVFRASSTPDADDNGVTIETSGGAKWVRVLDGYVTPEMFGWDRTTTDATTLMANVKAAMQTASIYQLKFEPESIMYATIVPFDDMQIIGSGWSDYLAGTTTTGTALFCPVGNPAAIDLQGVDTLHIQDCDISGNNYTGEAIGDTGGANRISLMRVKLIEGTNGFGGDGGDPASNVSMLHVVIRQNETGMRGMRDSVFTNVTLSGNRLRGWYCNEGQVRFSNGFLEWNRGASNEASNAIELGANSNEVIVSGNQFDHNSGNDVYMFGGGGTDINITGNMMKGAGWGTDLSKSERMSIFAASGSSPTGVSITNNTFQSRSYNPSGIQGKYSPWRVCNLANATGVVYMGNNEKSITNPYNISGKTWTESSVAGEYYMSDSGSDPWVDEPDFMIDGETTLSSGTVGSLSSDSWDWGDNDSLGFNTIYVKLSSGLPSASDVSMIVGVPMVSLGSSDIQTNEFRDIKGGVSLNAAAATTFQLKTREKLSGTFSRKAITLMISGDETSTSSDSFTEFGIILSRSGSGISVSAKEGVVRSLESGFTTGWASSGPHTLDVSVSARATGDVIDVTLTNNGSNRLDLECWIPW